VYNQNEDSINYVMLRDNALLLLRVVLARVLAPAGLCIQWLVSRCRLIALVLALPAPLLLLLVVLTRVLAPLARLLQWLVSRCRLIGLVLVGTLQDGYIHNVPLPRVVPREQSASPTSIAPPAMIPVPGYLQLPSWIPTLPRIGSVLGFSQRIL
jgi:hypothetical protein